MWGAFALRVHQYLQSQPNSIQFTAAVNSIHCNSSHSKPQLSMKRTLSWSTHSPSVYIRTCSNRFNSTPTRFNSSQCRKVEFIKLGSQICRTHSTSVYISTCNLKQIHILSGVASPVTTYHAAKESMSVNLKKNGNFKIDPLVVEHALARSVHQYLQSQTGLIRDTAASRLNSKHSRKMQVLGDKSAGVLNARVSEKYLSRAMSTHSPAVYISTYNPKQIQFKTLQGSYVRLMNLCIIQI